MENGTLHITRRCGRLSSHIEERVCDLCERFALLIKWFCFSPPHPVSAPAAAMSARIYVQAMDEMNDVSASRAHGSGCSKRQTRYELECACVQCIVFADAAQLESNLQMTAGN